MDTLHGNIIKNHISPLDLISDQTTLRKPFKTAIQFESENT